MQTVGLILWGVSIDKSYHWIVGQVAFFFCISPIYPISACFMATEKKNKD